MIISPAFPATFAVADATPPINRPNIYLIDHMPDCRHLLQPSQLNRLRHKFFDVGLIRWSSGTNSRDIAADHLDDKTQPDNKHAYRQRQRKPARDFQPHFEHAGQSIYQVPDHDRDCERDQQVTTRHQHIDHEGRDPEGDPESG